MVVDRFVLLHHYYHRLHLKKSKKYSNSFYAFIVHLWQYHTIQYQSSSLLLQNISRYIVFFSTICSYKFDLLVWH